MESMQWPGMFEDDVFLERGRMMRSFPTKKTRATNVEFWSCLFVLCGEVVLFGGKRFKSFLVVDVVDVCFLCPTQGIIYSYQSEYTLYLSKSEI